MQSSAISFPRPSSPTSSIGLDLPVSPPAGADGGFSPANAQYVCRVYKACFQELVRQVARAQLERGHLLAKTWHLQALTYENALAACDAAVEAAETRAADAERRAELCQRERDEARQREARLREREEARQRDPPAAASAGRAAARPAGSSLAFLQQMSTPLRA